MQYMLGYMIEGEARNYHLKLSDQLANRFGFTPVSSRIDPHLTLKTPFEANDISEIEKISRTFAEKEKSKPLTLGIFSDFNKRVIYMDVTAPKQTYMLIRRLQDKLRNVWWLQFSPKEFSITLHATLCYPKDFHQGKEILLYLSSEKPVSFELSLNNISILQRGTQRWEVTKTFYLQ